MIIDLSHRLTAQTAPFPGDPKFESTQVLTDAVDGYNVRAVRFSTHWGTHLDAPAHVNATALDVALIPLTKLYGDCVCIPLNNKGNLKPDSTISLDSLTPFETIINRNKKVLFQTGWNRFWNAPDYFAHAPGFSLDALDFLIQAQIELVGFDLPSPCREDDELAGHRLLLNNGVVIVENMTNLDQLPAAPKTFILSAFPLAIEGLDGFPVRAAAFL